MYSSKRMNLGSLLKEQRDPAGPDPRKTLTMLWGKQVNLSQCFSLYHRRLTINMETQ